MVFGGHVDLHVLIWTIHVWILPVHVWIWTIHVWILPVHVWILPVHVWILPVHVWILPVHVLILPVHVWILPVHVLVRTHEILKQIVVVHQTQIGGQTVVAKRDYVVDIQSRIVNQIR